MDIPLDISDITNICKKFSNLSIKSRKILDLLLEEGVNSINSGKITFAEVFELKEFLVMIKDNSLFGDASEQADLILKEINYFYIPQPTSISLWN